MLFLTNNPVSIHCMVTHKNQILALTAETTRSLKLNVHSDTRHITAKQTWTLHCLRPSVPDSRIRIRVQFTIKSKNKTQNIIKVPSKHINKMIKVIHSNLYFASEYSKVDILKSGTNRTKRLKFRSLDLNTGKLLPWVTNALNSVQFTIDTMHW